MAGVIFTEIIKECERFARKEVRPGALEADLSADQDAARLLWEKTREMDLPILLIPEAFGGAGMDPLTGGLVLDRLAMECAGFASIIAHHFAACAAVAAARTAEAEKWFSDLTGPAGDDVLMASLCFPPAPGDAAAISKNKEHLVLSGGTSFTGNIGLAKTFILFARGNENNNEPVAVRIDPSASGVVVEAPLSLPGLKMNAFGRLLFQDARVEDQDILATGAAAEKMIKTAGHVFYGFVSAMAMGCARSAFQKAKDYAGQRYQFKQLIIFHQEIQRLLGNMRMKLNMGTAGYLDLLDDKQWRPPFHTPEASLAKVFCTDAALEIVIDAIQIHGGYGYMHEYGLEKCMRDVKVLQVLGQTNPYLLVRHIADAL